MKDIKLYGVFHKEFPKPLRCDWLYPVAVGENSSSISCCELNDSSGVNVSHLNPYYNELTAHYWVRHNRPSQYVGFYHYRRYFSFQSIGNRCIKNVSTPPSNDIFDFLTSRSQYDKLDNLLNVYDVVTPSQEFQISIEDQYVYWHDRKPWDVFLNVLEIHFPKYSRSIEYFKLAHHGPYWNMFVMPWHLFCEYLDELFIVLGKVSEVVGHQGGPFAVERYPAYLAERFFGLYLLVNRLTTCQVQMVMFNEPLNDQEESSTVQL